jgi:ABC-2 type transport system ATP-binding protein
MDFTDLTGLKDRLITQLSKGMNQRLWLAKSLIHDPDLLMMDEPAAGLDPKARVEFKNLVRILAAQGKTLLISSHILTELEQMCDILLFIDSGQIIHHGSAETLLVDGTDLTQVDIWVSTPIRQLIEWGKQQELIFLSEHKRGARFEVYHPNPQRLGDLLTDAIRAGNKVYRFTQEDKTLEDVFVSMVSQKRNS